MQSEVAIIGLCTCRRPQLLQNCLESLKAQIIPPAMTLSLVVVDNEPEPNNRQYVTAFAATCPFPVHYVHQPVRGIAVARNAILDKAQALGAEWIAMLDDDETADPGWIAGLIAPEYRHVPVLQGRRILVYPEPRPFWLRRKESRPTAEGVPVDRVSTFNVRFSADLIKAGLRFDESLGLCGGEDVRFFSQAAEAGFEARYTNKAVTFEPVHAERFTYRSQVARHYGQAAGNAAHQIKSYGRKVMLARIPKLMADVPIGIFEIAISPAAALFGVRRFRGFALRGGHRLAHAAGSLSALFGRLPQQYRHIVGS
jgi:succinoglycan biosynthesis protein ExoM